MPIITGNTRESNMSKSIDAGRTEEIADMLDGMLGEGEAIIARHNGSVIEVSATSGAMRVEHPQLYGRLLAASEDISNAGTSLLPIVGIGAMGVCLAIQLEWFEAFGIDAEKVRSFWFYGAVMLAGFFVFAYLVTVLERRAFRRHRGSLAKAAREAGYDRFVLLSEIEGDASLKNVAEAIKTERNFEAERDSF
jgi:hypothetical protein